VGREVASARVEVRWGVLLLVILAPAPATWAQGTTGSAPLPPAKTAPAARPSTGAVDASDWLDGSPAAADSADAATDSLRRSGTSAGDTIHPQGLTPVPGSRLPEGAGDAGASHPDTSVAIRPDQAGSPAESPAADRALRLPPHTATGVSIGYPAYPGLFIVAPSDGRLAFRSGLTGFPTIGILLTPGLEYRFGQEAGTLSDNGVYAFGNAFLGRSYLNHERDYTGMEAGLGFRWPIDDRRGVRWIAAVEAGGYWRGERGRPRHPCLRFIWMLVE
jgi:hypothetical protein